MGKILLNDSLWAAGTLALLGLALYGFLWLPYREPEHQQPPLLEILPEAQEATVTESNLDEYGWVDREAGVVRIPIHVAMEIMVERLVTDGESNAASATGPDVPHDAGSGRFPRPRRSVANGRAPERQPETTRNDDVQR